MKKRYFSVLVLLCCTAAQQAAAAANLPFVGTRSFSFGGVPAYNENYTLSIKPNGQTKLTMRICYSEGCDKAATLYSGPFKPLVPFRQDGQAYYLRLGKTEARLLNSKKQQEYDCDSLNLREGPCVSEYYR
ncbi:MAG: hypothetical protein Q4D82_04505 [Neisseria sp.]|nr:hypothetical protein [Neisseria sp.]